MLKLKSRYEIDEEAGHILRDGHVWCNDYSATRDGRLLGPHGSGMLRCECGSCLKWIPGQVWCPGCKHRKFQEHLATRRAELPRLRELEREYWLAVILGDFAEEEVPCAS